MNESWGLNFWRLEESDSMVASVVPAVVPIVRGEKADKQLRNHWIGDCVPPMVCACLRVFSRPGPCENHPLDADVGTRDLDHLTFSICEI